MGLKNKMRGALTPMLLMGLRSSTLAIKFGLTLYIAKYLSLEILGIYGLLASALILLPSITTFGINQSLARHGITDDAADVVVRLRGYLSVLIAFYAIGGLVAFFIVRADPTWMSVFAFSFVLLALENINSDAYYLLTNRLQPILANVLHFVRSALWGVVFVVASWIFTDLRSLHGLLVFWLLGSVASFLVLTWSIRSWPIRQLFKDIKTYPQDLKRQLAESWFLYTNGLVTSVGAQADRFVITAFLGLELTGVYVFFVQIGSALSNLHYTGIIQLQRPKVLLSLERGIDALNANVSKVLYTSIASTVLTSAIAFFVVQWLLPFLDKPLLMHWSGLLYFVLVSVVVNVTVEAQRIYFYSLREDKIVFYVNLLASMTALVLLALVLNIYSLFGAGLALVVAGALRLFGQYMSIEWINRRMQPSAP